MISKVFKETGISFLYSALPMGFLTGVNILLLKYLPVTEYGLYSYSISLIKIFACVSGMGIPYACIRFSSHGYSIKDVLHKSYSAYKYSIIVGIIIVSIIWSYTTNQRFLYLPIVIINTILFLLLTHHLGMLKGMDKIISANKLKGFADFCYAFGIILVIIFSDISRGEKLLLLWGVILLGFVVISFAVVQNNIKRFDSNETKTLPMKQLITITLPIFALSLSGMFSMNFDRMFISKMLGAEALGIYSSAVLMVMPLAFLGLILETTLLPKLRQQQSIGRLLAYVTLVAIGIVVAYFLCIDNILQTLCRLGIINKAYLKASLAIKILSIGYGATLIYSVPAALVSYHFEQRDLWKLLAVFILIGVVLNGILQQWLINTYRLQGAAVATTVVLVLRMFVWLFYARGVVGISMPITDNL